MGPLIIWFFLVSTLSGGQGEGFKTHEECETGRMAALVATDTILVSQCIQIELRPK